MFHEYNTAINQYKFAGDFNHFRAFLFDMAYRFIISRQQVT